MKSINELDVYRQVKFAPYLKDKGPTFQLITYNAGLRPDGKECLGYRLTMKENNKTSVLFEGEDMGLSPLHGVDSDASIEALMGFLTLKPGDTDSEYFEKYTQEQFDFCNNHAEALGWEVERRFGTAI